MVFWVVDQCLLACWPRRHTPPARRPAGPQAPSNVSVNERAKGGALVLPRKRIHAPGTNHQ
eukprot:1145482-Alexandrium_andersonii.AAC.1